MSRLSGPLLPSVEALLYRGESPLFHELKLVYADVLAGDATALARVAKVIQHHTHMDISVQPFDCQWYDMSIWFVPFDINHVLRNPAFQKKEGMAVNVSLYKTLMDGGQAAVDNKGAVSGVFTKIPAVILFSTNLIDGQFTADELAAGTLHEVGHFYNYFDILGRTIATSFVIQDTMTQLSKTTDLAHRFQIVDQAAKILDFDGLDSDALAPVGQEKAFEYIAIRSTVAKIHSDLGDAKLFGSEVEFMADSYAVHSGAAIPLASLHAKIAKSKDHVQTRSTTAYIATEASKVALFVAGNIFPATIPVTALIAGMCIALANGTSADRDTPVERLEAVHADLVNLLKDTSLPSELKESLLQDVQFISGLREQVVDRMTLVTHLWLTISPGRRHIYKQVKLQREIGKLVNNELFVKAAQLSTITPSV